MFVLQVLFPLQSSSSSSSSSSLFGLHHFSAMIKIQLLNNNNNNNNNNMCIYNAHISRAESEAVTVSNNFVSSRVISRYG